VLTIQLAVSYDPDLPQSPQLGIANLAFLLEPLEEERVSIPIRRKTDRALISSNSRSRFRAEPAIGFPSRKAVGTQQHL
jgi:hypothetical protein